MKNELLKDRENLQTSSNIKKYIQYLISIIKQILNSQYHLEKSWYEENIQTHC